MWMNVKRILEKPYVYTLFQRIYGGEYAREIFIDKYVKPTDGMKILDVGCGPGEILRYLPRVHYTGIDIDAKYISRARDNFGSRANFLHSDIKNIDYKILGTFDVIMAIGVLHHLSDEENIFLFDKIEPLLGKDGFFITLDPCLYPAQGRFRNFANSLDRGRYVREGDQYASLLRRQFAKTELFPRAFTIFRTAHLITKSWA